MKINRAFLFPLIALLCLLAACGSPSNDEPGGQENAFEPVIVYDQDGTPVAVIDQDEPRSAYLVEVENEVSARQSEVQEFSPAEQGLSLGEGGQALSGADGRARFDLLPDGTIVRMGPDTQFIVTELSSDPASPLTRLELILGQIWILLNGGDIDIKTDSGSAAVRGSMMSVSYDPETGDMAITCLTGICTLENELGSIELTAGEASSIPGQGAPPNPPYPISEEDLNKWEQQVPESGTFEENRQAPPPPPPGEPGPGGGDPDNYNSTDPITYNFTNLCYLDWYWEFTGDNGTYNVTVPANGTASGEIPGGLYQVRDWNDGGHEMTGETVGGSHFDTTFNCPNPEDENNPPPP